jgi:hypothetical protein
MAAHFFSYKERILRKTKRTSLSGMFAGQIREPSGDTEGPSTAIFSARGGQKCPETIWCYRCRGVLDESKVLATTFIPSTQRSKTFALEKTEDGHSFSPGPRATHRRRISADLQELENIPFTLTSSIHAETLFSEPATDNISTPALSVSARKQFTHTNLDLSRQEFRLLRIRPTESCSTIDCEIRSFEFGNCPFVALSYAWGDLHCLKEIQINHLPYSVGQNLCDFLEVACSAGITEWLWIDALCIDQSNTAERNHQVGLMDKIYAGASRVIAWLGPAANSSNYIINLIGFANGPGFKGAFRDFSNPRLLSRNHLFLRPFWRRVWIIQELLLAPDIEFMCGYKRVSYSNMSIWIRQMKIEIEKDPTFFTSSTDVMNAIQCVIAIFENKVGSENRTGNAPLNYNYRLKDTLEAFQLFESSDVRDRVYGLLSLVKPEDRIPVDYSKTADQVFCDVIHKFGNEKDIFPKIEDLCTFSWRLSSVWRLENLYPSVVKDLALYAFNGQEAEVLYTHLKRLKRNSMLVLYSKPP